jgi:uncharacterized protein (UPF0332 family)
VTDDQLELIMEARDSIAAAKLLLDGEFPGYAASRSYFAMFYIAEALLEGEGLSFSKHSAVISAFGREFARSGRVPAEFHRYLMEAQELRHSGDYGTRDAVNYEQALEQIVRAEQFLHLAERLLGDIPT